MVDVEAHLDAVLAALDESLAEVGFVRAKRARIWRLTGPEVLEVVDLQRSSYGPKFYVNIGFWIRSHDPTVTAPKSHQCHVVARVEDFWPAKESAIAALLTLDIGDDSPKERGRALHAIVGAVATSALVRGSTVEGLRSMRAEGLLNRSRVKQAALDKA
jgi:Domain of unknown function (DUF4304)